MHDLVQPMRWDMSGGKVSLKNTRTREKCNKKRLPRMLKCSRLKSCLSFRHQSITQNIGYCFILFCFILVSFDIVAVTLSLLMSSRWLFFFIFRQYCCFFVCQLTVFIVLRFQTKTPIPLRQKSFPTQSQSSTVNASVDSAI